jgi:hypothetical protein
MGNGFIKRRLVMNKKLLLLSLVSISLCGIKATEDVVMENQNNDAQPEMVQTNVQEKTCRRSCWHKVMSPSLDDESQQVHHSRHHHRHHGMQEGQEACMKCEKHKRMQKKRRMCGTPRMRRHMKNQENVVPMDPVVVEDAIEPETRQIDENQMAQDDTDAQPTIFTPVVDVTDGVADVTEDVLEVPGEMFGCHYNNQN